MLPRRVQFSLSSFIGHPHDPWGVADNVCGTGPEGSTKRGRVARRGRGKCGLEGMFPEPNGNSRRNLLSGSGLYEHWTPIGFCNFLQLALSNVR